MDRSEYTHRNGVVCPAARKDRTMSTLGKLCCFAATVLVLLSTTAVGVLAEEGETVADPDAIPAVQITTGSSHACALTEDGGVLCWGSNDAGRLGIGQDEEDVPFSNAPLDVAGLDSGIDGVYAAYAHTCAVTSTGGVKCWGGNWSGQLGDGTTISSNVPVDVPGLTGVKAIAGGGAHTCALTNDGGVKCWGANERGQLGDGTRTASRTPVDVEGLASGVKAIAAHDTDGSDYERGFTCALLDTGVKCWGDGYGLTPEFVPGIGSEAMAIDAGFEYACAVFNTGGIKCWGRENYSATSGDIVSVSGGGHSGDYNTCVVLNDGRAECWGENDRGEVGDGTTEARGSPVDVIGLGGEVSMISMGGSFACALLEDGRVQCWGNNRIGQCGDGTQTMGLSPSYVFGLESGVESVTAGWSHTCAVTTDGVAKCWGNNGYGQCGDGNVFTIAETPVDVVGLDSGVEKMAAGFEYTDALVGGGVKRWGDGTPTPQDVAGLTSGVRGYRLAAPC